MRARTVIFAAVLFASASVAGCSAEFSIGGESPESAAEDLIEGELSDQIGLAMTAACDDVADPEVGSTFSCTGTTPDGDEVRFDAEIDAEDHINVDSTNVIVADQLAQLESGAVDALNAQTGASLDAAAIDCGDDAVILGDDGMIACVLTDPATGDVYDTTITITDLDAGTFDVDVADAPRG